MNQIFQQQWMALDKSVRYHLIMVFKIPQTGISEVRDQTPISDYTSAEDLKAITLEKMCEYIGSQETFGRAWELTLAKVHSELHPPVGVIGDNMSVGLVSGGTIEEIEKVIEPKSEVVETQIPWCSTCASLGGRHKKDCPKNVAPKSHDTI